MKKKLMMVAVLLGALSLGACVDDNESASVTQLRDAKAQQLSALASKAEAEGRAAEIKANAEAALLEAQAAYQEEMTEEARQRFAADIEKIKAQAEAEIAKAKKEAAMYEQQLLNQADEYVAGLYAAYKTALGDLNELEDSKIEAQFNLAKMQAGLGTVQSYAETFVAQKQAEIERYKAEKEAWQNYSGLNSDDLNAQLDVLNQQLYAAEATEAKAEDDRDAKQKKATEILDAYDKENKESSVAAIVAMQNYSEENVFELWYEAAYSTPGQINSWNYINTWYNEEYHDGAWYYVIPNAVSIWYAGEQYFVNPFETERIELSEEANLNSEASIVEQYSLNIEAKAILDKYYSDKRSLVDTRGHKASETQVATGFYAYLANAEEAAAASKKAYDDAVAKVATLEASVAAAEKKIDEAEKAVKDAEAEVKAKQDAYDKAVKAENDVKANPNATQVQIEQAELNTAVAEADLNLANAEKDQADATLVKVNNDNAQAVNDFYTLKNSLDGLQQTAEADVAEVAHWNQQIENITKEIDNFDANAALWAEVTKAVEAEEYTKAIEALKTNADIVAYVESEATLAEAQKATQKVRDEQGVINDLLGSANDPDYEIAELDKKIAKAQLAIDEVEDNVLSEIDASESIAGMQKMIAQYEAEIELLDEQIAAQEGVVAMRKAAVEAAINDGETTTPDTPAEEQPAA